MFQDGFGVGMKSWTYLCRSELSGLLRSSFLWGHFCLASMRGRLVVLGWLGWLGGRHKEKERAKFKITQLYIYTYMRFEFRNYIWAGGRSSLMRMERLAILRIDWFVIFGRIEMKVQGREGERMQFLQSSFASVLNFPYRLADFDWLAGKGQKKSIRLYLAWVHSEGSVGHRVWSGQSGLLLVRVWIPHLRFTLTGCSIIFLQFSLSTLQYQSSELGAWGFWHRGKEKLIDWLPLKDTRRPWKAASTLLVLYFEFCLITSKACLVFSSFD